MKNLKKIISVTAAAAMVMSTVAPVSVFADSMCTFFNAFFDEWDKIACAVRSSVHERRKNLKFP